MSTSELGFVGLTLLGAVFVLSELIAAKSWKTRALIVAVGLFAGLAGVATVFGFHEVCCVNYRWGGEYKRDGNNLSDWLGFVAPLLLQLGAFGGVYAVRRRRFS